MRRQAGDRDSRWDAQIWSLPDPAPDVRMGHLCQGWHRCAGRAMARPSAYEDSTWRTNAGRGQYLSSIRQPGSTRPDLLVYTHAGTHEQRHQTPRADDRGSKADATKLRTEEQRESPVPCLLAS